MIKALSKCSKGRETERKVEEQQRFSANKTSDTRLDPCKQTRTAENVKNREKVIILAVFNPVEF